MSHPEWLPPLLDVSEKQEDTILRLYEVFAEDFKDSGCEFRNVPVQFSRRILPAEQHEEVFWHLISKESGNKGKRNFDSCRAKRLSWCKAIIEHSHEDTVTVWRDYVHGRLRTFLWLEDYDFNVVLEEGTRKSGKIALLVTAYCVEDRTRKRLRNSYRRRVL